LIPRAAFFISDFPFVAFVRNRISGKQQDFPDITFFRGGLSFVPLLSDSSLPIGSPGCHFGLPRRWENVGDESDHPNVYVAVAFSSTESLNWDGKVQRKTVNFKTNDSGSSIKGFSLVGAVAASPEPNVPKPACVQPDF
jgi:hypothetical protein